MSRVVVKPYSTGTSPVGMPPKIRDGQDICTTAAYFVCGIILIGSGMKENRAKISAWEIDQGG